MRRPSRQQPVNEVLRRETEEFDPRSRLEIAGECYGAGAGSPGWANHSSRFCNAEIGAEIPSQQDGLC